MEGPLAVSVTAPRHPLVQGVEGYQVAEARVPAGPAAGATPEMIVLDAHPEGARVLLGAVWTRGRGRLFHYQPGGVSALALAPVRVVLRNATRWLRSSHA
jgi:trehalose utilization protein